MISTGDVRKGVIIELDGQLMKVLDWTHIKMARGSANAGSASATIIRSPPSAGKDNATQDHR